jgi:hypothetical protein
MSELTILGTNVEPGTDADYWQRLAGEAILAGQVVYLASDDDRFYLARNSGSPAAAEVKGIAVNVTDFPGQPLRVQTAGTIGIVSSPPIAEGSPYLLGPDPGFIMPGVDLAFGQFCTLIGVGGPNDTLLLNPFGSATKLA